MIAKQYGSNIMTSTDSGVPIADFYISSESEVLGYSDDFILIRNGAHVYTVDSRGVGIGFMQVPEEYPITRVTSSGFSVKKGKLLESYGPDCRQTGQTYL
jgi:hypothetical protein